MDLDRPIPNDPLDFIRRCISEGRILWTYHVNMRLESRSIPRTAIVSSREYYEIIEQYPQDKYLPSYLVRSEYKGKVLHILFAVDVEADRIRIITSYHPAPEEWDEGFRVRRASL